MIRSKESSKKEGTRKKENDVRCKERLNQGRRNVKERKRKCKQASKRKKK